MLTCLDAEMCNTYNFALSTVIIWLLNLHKWHQVQVQKKKKKKKNLPVHISIFGKFLQKRASTE